MVATVDSARAWIARLGEVYARDKAMLTDLDSPIGDADHGINMDRGFTAVQLELNKTPGDTIAEVLKTTAMTLIRTVGGASGPLYGTWFLKASIAAGEASTLDAERFVAVVREAVEGLKVRGKADVGAKTMIDVWGPVLDRMEQDLQAGADLSVLLREATEVARERMEATIPMLATKGRASFLGERSIGHQDPGATSSFLMIEAARDTLPVQE